MKILLNCLPPTDINSPSISLSILKKFMHTQGVETGIKYWNFDLSVMDAYTDCEDTEIKMLPFLSMLNDKDNYGKGNQRILSLLQKLDPSLKITDPHYYSDFLKEKKIEIFDTIEQELKAIDFNDILLFGISAKYNQWIPGIILAEEVKKLAPHVKIIVGGFGSRDSAQEAMKLCMEFDFASWGEGEYPLLELWQQINSKNSAFNIVPRLMYRKNNELMQSETQASKYLDFNNYIYPDYNDFVDQHPDFEDNDQINFPINTIRSCHWSKCKFCDFNKGYKLRMRSPKCIVNEIEHLTNTYGVSTFSFVDSDTFGNQKHFEALLDLIIDLKYLSEEDFIFWAEMIPNKDYNAKILEKMAIAGFKNLFIGFDGLSDTLLQKMNKSNSFSDNIFFVKDALKNGINPLVNVIKHVPNETEEDVLECIDNLHYLRFFYNNSIVNYFHTYVDLVLSSMTKYYSQMQADELANYTLDDYSYLLPERFSNSPDRFHLFRYAKNAPQNIKEWNKLIEIEEYYKTNKFNYRIQEHKGIYYYTEYCNDTEISNITFSEPEYIIVLKLASSKVWEFSSLLSALQNNFHEITANRLQEILRNLKADHLIYCNTGFSNVVSIVNL